MDRRKTEDRCLHRINMLATRIEASARVALRLSSPLRFVVAGAPACLDGAPVLHTPADLACRNGIRFRMARSGRVAEWSFVQDGARIEEVVGGRLIVNDTPLMLAAALMGHGLIQIAEPVVADYLAKGRLRTVLDRFAPETPGLFLYYPRRNAMVPKLRAFLDFLRG